jgi:signal transduction histidine kinase
MTSYRAKLQLALLAIGLFAVGLTSWQALSGSTEALRAATYERLTVLRQTRAQQIERYFQELGNHILALSVDESTLDAMEEFTRVWSPAVQPLFLHHPLRLRAPGAYGDVHARYHPTFHRYQTAFGLYDIFLLSPEGDVLYTVAKESDFASRPSADSPLGTAHRAAWNLNEPEQFILQDYRPYPPSNNAPAAFLAAPVFRAGHKIGVLAIQLSSTEVNRVMTSGGQWREAGLGETGESYLVGPDGLLRSDLRHPRHPGAGILSTRVSPEVARLHHAAPGTEIGIDHRQVRVLRSHSRINVPGLDWSLMAEIDEAEAHAAIGALRTRTIGLGAVIGVVLLFVAALLARSVTEPLLALAEDVRRLGRRQFGTRLPVSSRDEIGQLAAAFNRMAEDLEKTTVSKSELELLAGRLMSAQEDERSRIARELHDDLSQRLAAVAIAAANLGDQSIKEQIASISHDIHSLSRQLHPAVLDDLGLPAALEAECRLFFERGGPPVDLTLAPAELPRNLQLVLYRIAQEALRNILKHAEATEVSLSLTGAHLTITDNGKGFDKSAPGYRAGVGLSSMEERARFAGGAVTITSRPGGGTIVDVELPYAA